MQYLCSLNLVCYKYVINGFAYVHSRLKEPPSLEFSLKSLFRLVMNHQFRSFLIFISQTWLQYIEPPQIRISILDTDQFWRPIPYSNLDSPGYNLDWPTAVAGEHTNSKGFLRVDGMRKKLCDEMVCFCLMHMQRSLLCPF